MMAIVPMEGRRPRRPLFYGAEEGEASAAAAGPARRMSHPITRALARALGVAALSLWCTIGQAAEPIKIAVFPFELEDFSPAGKQGGTAQPVASTEEALAQSTEEAKQQLIQSGRYSVIDTAGAEIEAAKGQGLRNCKGCEAGIAMELGADQSLLGVVHKISMMEYVVRFHVRDARNGEVVSTFETGLRMGADYSWSRGVRSLMKNRMLAAR